MSENSKVLGKGMDSLLPNDFDQSFLLDENERIQKIEITKVSPNTNQPRKQFDDEAIDQLASSIKQYGVLQPLIVSPLDAGKYVIIAGERRYRASLKAGLTTLPVIVRSSEELEKLEIALVENVQRVDLSPLEQSASVERLHQQFNMSYKEIAEKLGKAETTIINIVRLIQLTEEAKAALNEGKISEGHAKSLLALKDYPDKQKELLSRIISNKWSVRQAEQFVVGAKKNKKTDKELTQHMGTESEGTKKLSKKLSTPVSIKRTARGGKLEITFQSDENLSDIIKTLLG